MDETIFCKDFKVIEKIGEGSFSTVFLAEDRDACRKLAIKKVTRTTSPTRIANELKFLMSVQGMKNIIEIVEIVREDADVFIVFPYVKMNEFKEIVERATLSDIKHYMYGLLTALQGVHSQGIIHRDIKPSNFLYNLETKAGYLIDFGLSQKLEEKTEEEVKEKRRRFFFSSHSASRSSKPIASRAPGYLIRDSRPSMSASRSGTRGFKAPEVLFRVESQTTAIDIWSAGVILLSLLCRKYPFFTSKDDINTMVELGTLFGDDEMRKAAKHYKRVWKSNIEACMHPKVPFEKVVEIANPGKHQLPSSVFDLLEKMLLLKASERISADEALRHRFFSD
ncbi:cell division control protein 7 [Nematocida minor]|uniref:cell division control protein 7 n=1 Tax=Nematocida minor TaxID=1912983 RepID=UPI0022209B4F|nr:cell division control protein 7 [Nematocida minor]KAI5189903.1 cell division control protein 7 [Nematocida minor]